MRPTSFPWCATLAVTAALLLPGSLPSRAQEIPTLPSPEQFFGFPMGAERQLAGWNRIVDYFQLVGRLSDRVLVQEVGKTTMGKPYILATVSTPDTIASLPRYQAMQKQLADPRRTSDADAGRIVSEGKVVLLVGANVHGTEIGTSQMVNDLIYKLATERSPWIDHVLENVILLLIPSQNPDGQQVVVDWHDQNVGTPYEGAPLPELYHKYVGHDNNRDSYMLTQVETQLLNQITYKDWLPEVYLDQHQMGNRYARIFVPPFKNPANPNVDPLVWSEVNLLGQTMAAKLYEAGKTGVIWGELYSGFWAGANSTNPWWHNMVALLTETASADLATTVVQERADPAWATWPTPGTGQDFRPPDSPDPNRPLPAPTDVQYRMNYPRPWLGGSWSLADVAEYELLATLGLLEGVANNRKLLKRNFYLMNERTIELFEAGSPYAYLVRSEQRDPVAGAKLLQLVQAGAAEVHRADAPFTADGREYPAGTYVLLLAQPFGRWVKDLLEPQKYPEIHWPFADTPVDRPYDVTAWSLGMLMGVETIRVDGPFDARLTLMTQDVEAPAGGLSGSGSTYLLRHTSNNSFIAMNRLLKDGADVSWALDEMELDGQLYDPGTILVSGASRSMVADITRELKLDVEATSQPVDIPTLAISAPRLAVYEPWGGNIDAGWTRWLLEQHELPYTQVRNEDLRRPDLHERFDVILIAEMKPDDIISGYQARNVRPEHRGGIGEAGIRRLREFLEHGGTIITLGNAAQFAIEHLGVPFVNVLQDVSEDDFFCPGSILRIAIDTTHPIAYGMPREADAMFINNGGYMLKPSALRSSAATIARYPQRTLLQSGWIIGEEKLRGTGAVLEATIGKGRVIMHTFRVQNRAQTWGTFKLLFNSIFYGPAMVGKPAVDTLQAAIAQP